MISYIKKSNKTFLLLPLLVPSIAFAQGSARIKNPIGISSIECLLVAILNAVVQVGAIVIVFFVIFAGFKYVTAGGNVTKVQKAHQALLWALIGGIMILGARGIALVIESTVENVTGVDTPSISGCS